MSKIAMTAKAGFSNPQIEGPRPDGAVLPGEPFKTNWLHAKDLKRNGLAEPDDPKALDVEPTDAIDPHHGLSVAEHAAINKRRAAAVAGGDGGDRGDNDRAKAAERALDRLETARQALREAEQAAQDKPSTAAKTRVGEAQREYDSAEAAAKEFTGT